MTKQQLKAIVKECLLEILQEGLSNVSAPVHSQRDNENHNQSRPHFSRQRVMPTNPALLSKKKRVSPLDMPATPFNQRKPSMSDVIKIESRGDPIMAKILADTARTTLPNMISNGDTGVMSEDFRPAHSITQQEQINGTPEQVFGEEVASRWANLAFTESPNKKST
jgi:hypothetical protein